jgi:hypothetical protein
MAHIQAHNLYKSLYIYIKTNIYIYIYTGIYIYTCGPPFPFWLKCLLLLSTTPLTSVTSKIYMEWCVGTVDLIAQYVSLTECHRLRVASQTWRARVEHHCATLSSVRRLLEDWILACDRRVQPWNVDHGTIYVTSPRVQEVVQRHFGPIQTQAWPMTVVAFGRLTGAKACKM